MTDIEVALPAKGSDSPIVSVCIRPPGKPVRDPTTGDVTMTGENCPTIRSIRIDARDDGRAINSRDLLLSWHRLRDAAVQQIINQGEDQ